LSLPTIATNTSMHAPENLTPPDLWAVVPAFNEAQALEPVVGALLQAGLDVVVVDDCSADNTAQAAARCWVVRHPINLGQGAALQTGIAFALSKGAQFIVTFDADGQHQTSDIPKMWATMQAAQADVVCGSRFLGTSTGMPASRRLLLKAAVLFQRITSGISLTDAHNGLRLLSRKAASLLDLHENRMAHASEILDQFVEHKLKVVEAPVHIAYTEYSLAKGQKSSDAIHIALSILRRKLLG
jgi:glycosyltransferase involved in cell wall biosynthesis